TKIKPTYRIANIVILLQIKIEIKIVQHLLLVSIAKEFLKQQYNLDKYHDNLNKKHTATTFSRNSMFLSYHKIKCMFENHTNFLASSLSVSFLCKSCFSSTTDSLISAFFFILYLVAAFLFCSFLRNRFSSLGAFGVYGLSRLVVISLYESVWLLASDDIKSDNVSSSTTN
ncbi:hypothetical protein AGLY_001026, partial [Aphis glycines]